MKHLYKNKSLIDVQNQNNEQKLSKPNIKRITQYLLIEFSFFLNTISLTTKRNDGRIVVVFIRSDQMKRPK